MTISGHKSRSVFERYNIVSDTDLRQAAIMQEAYLQKQMVTKTVTIGNFQEKGLAMVLANPLDAKVNQSAEAQN